MGNKAPQQQISQPSPPSTSVPTDSKSPLPSDSGSAAPSSIPSDTTLLRTDMSQASTTPDPESFVDRAIRKFSQEPLIPLGALATVGFLANGLRQFRLGNSASSQQMMRGRVIAQGATILVVLLGSFGFKLKPHDRPKTYEEKLENINKSQ